MKTILPIILLAIFLITCKDEDPCEGVTCLNDGVCINGQCDCPENYEGAACGDQKTPSKIQITKMSITKFPPVPGSGGGWDSDSGPDIFPEIKSGNTIVYQSDVYYENVTDNTSTYEFTPGATLELSATTTYTFYIFDYDPLDANDVMFQGTFDAYDDTNGFPATITFDGGTASFRLDMTYSF